MANSIQFVCALACKPSKGHDKMVALLSWATGQHYFRHSCAPLHQSQAGRSPPCSSATRFAPAPLIVQRGRPLASSRSCDQSNKLIARQDIGLPPRRPLLVGRQPRRIFCSLVGSERAELRTRAKLAWPS